MSIRYYIVSYIRNQKRGENRNVGLVMVTDNTHFVKFLGVNEDGSFNDDVLKELGLDAEIYESWIKYYTREVAKGTLGDSLERKRLKMNPFIENTGYVLSEVDSPSDLFENLFNELIA